MRIRRFFWWYLDHALESSQAHRLKRNCWHWYNTPCWQEHLNFKAGSKRYRAKIRQMKRQAR